jgi:hypothetical protein
MAWAMSHTFKGAFGHEWTWGLTRCQRCGVSLDEYERGDPYQCPGSSKIDSTSRNEVPKPHASSFKEIT